MYIICIFYMYYIFSFSFKGFLLSKFIHNTKYKGTGTRLSAISPPRMQKKHHIILVERTIEIYFIALIEPCIV
jgi:hypothetical protein